jgi:hypothetical protein
VFQCNIVWSFIACFKVKRSDILTIKNIVAIHIHHWEDTIPKEDTISRRIQSQGGYNLLEDTIPRRIQSLEDTMPQEYSIPGRIQYPGMINPQENTIPREYNPQEDTIPKSIKSSGRKQSLCG